MNVVRRLTLSRADTNNWPTLDGGLGETMVALAAYYFASFSSSSSSTGILRSSPTVIVVGRLLPSIICHFRLPLCEHFTFVPPLALSKLVFPS